MPGQNNQQSPSSYTRPKRRVLESRDLPQTGGAYATSSSRDNGSSHSNYGPCHSNYGSCTCDEDDCAPGTCCAKDRQCKSNSKACPRQHLCRPPTPTPIYMPICPKKSLEVDAMINEMKSCQEAIRTLTQEAMEMLHSEQECPVCKQEAQKKPIVKRPHCERCDDSNVYKPKSLDLEGPSKAKLLAMPPPRYGSHSRTSSVPIAQQAFQIKEGRMPKTDDIEKNLKQGNDIDNDIEKKLKNGNETESDFEKSLKKKNKADIDMEMLSKQPNKEDSKNVFQKIFGKKSSANSSDERQIAERNKSECICPEDMLKPNKKKCQCHFPPSYNQYFTCTGQVSGNCNCEKNA